VGGDVPRDGGDDRRGCQRGLPRHRTRWLGGSAGSASEPADSLTVSNLQS